MGWGVYTRSHLLKLKKVIIIQSDFRTLELLTVGKYLSHRWGGRSRVESAEGGKKGDQEGAGVPDGWRGEKRGNELALGTGLPAETGEGGWDVSERARWGRDPGSLPGCRVCSF